MNELYALLHLKCIQKGLTLLFEIDPGSPEFVQADPTRLRQILMNLIGNAIKFTSEGFVKVSYKADGEDLYFKVQDSGIGISSEQQQNLFQNFTQGDKSISRQFAGTGLGLALSQQLAKLLGGDVELLESSVGKGSTFVARVSFQKASVLKNEISQNSNVKVDPVLNGKKILVVDDSVDSQYLMVHILKKYGCLVTSAFNGEEALKITDESHFDLILMDMQMPVMDGYAATRKLRLKNCLSPIIALTAHAMKEDRDLCLQAGCVQYVSKPTHTAELIETIRNTLIQRKNSLC